MQYIHLSNDSFILKTSNGNMHTLTRESFNFNKIKRLLSNDAPEETIMPLLETPKLPNGIFKAYVNLNNTIMYYQHIKNNKDGTVTTSMHYIDGKLFDTAAHMKFVGIYASKEELILDWPEYTI